MAAKEKPYTHAHTSLAALLLGALAAVAELVKLLFDGRVVVRAGEAAAHGLAALLLGALFALALHLPGVRDGRVVVGAPDAAAHRPFLPRGRRGRRGRRHTPATAAQARVLVLLLLRHVWFIYCCADKGKRWAIGRRDQ